VVLDDLEPAAFEIFVNWLYTSKIPVEWEEWLERKVGEEDYFYCCRISMLTLKAYVVADRLGVQELLELINNQYVDCNIQVPPWYEGVIYAFSNIPSGRRILGMMVATHCAFSLTEFDELAGQEALRDRLPVEFLLQVFEFHQQMRSEKTWSKKPRACDYHEHASEEEREKCNRKTKKT
jgi:hypothetical protein